MRQADALLVPGTTVEVEAEAGSGGERHTAFGECADPQLRALQVREDADGPADLPLNGTDDVAALLVILVRAVAEVEAEYVCPRLEETSDDLRTGTRRAEGGDDLGIAVTMHIIRGLDGRPSLGCEDQDGVEVFALVRVGPVTSWPPSAAKK